MKGACLIGGTLYAIERAPQRGESRLGSAQNLFLLFGIYRVLALFEPSAPLRAMDAVRLFVHPEISEALGCCHAIVPSQSLYLGRGDLGHLSFVNVECSDCLGGRPFARDFSVRLKEP